MDGSKVAMIWGTAMRVIIYSTAAQETRILTFHYCWRYRTHHKLAAETEWAWKEFVYGKKFRMAVFPRVAGGGDIGTIWVSLSGSDVALEAVRDPVEYRRQIRYLKFDGVFGTLRAHSMITMSTQWHWWC
jgi:hypothetical protein